MASRYLTHERLPLFSYPNKNMGRSRATIVGMGALGSGVAILLARAGIGTLTLIDRDIVEEENLISQTLYTSADISKTKIEAAMKNLKLINPLVHYVGKAAELHGASVQSLLSGGMVFDCTDNLETRFALNDFMHAHQRPWIHTAVQGVTGVCGIINPQQGCFSCYVDSTKTSQSCEETGVLNCAALGTASQAVSLFYSYIADGVPPVTTLYRTHWLTFRTIPLTIPRKGCPTCRKDYRYLGRTPSPAIRLCGSHWYSQRLALRLSRQGLSKRFGDNRIEANNYRCIIDGRIVAFYDGRILARARTQQHARSIITRYFPH